MECKCQNQTFLITTGFATTPWAWAVANCDPLMPTANYNQLLKVQIEQIKKPQIH